MLEGDEFDSRHPALVVNGQTRQKEPRPPICSAGRDDPNSTFANVMPGDPLLTGTPSGCVLRASPPVRRRRNPAGPEVLEAVRQRPRRAVRTIAARRPISARIRSDDGRSTRGEQKTLIAG